MRKVFLAGVAALVLSLSATDGRSAIAAPDYKFEIVGQPVSEGPNTAITVRVIDSASGKPVTPADVYYQTLQPPNNKTVFSILHRVPLTADGHGTYTLLLRGTVAEGKLLRFAATLPEGATVYGNASVRFSGDAYAHKN